MLILYNILNCFVASILYSDFKMENQNEHFRHILYYYFKKDIKASEIYRKLYAVYSIVIERTCQIWFRKFCSRNFFFQDRSRSGRPIEIDDD